MVHTYLAEYQPNALTHSRTNGEKHAVKGQAKGYFMMLSTSENGNADTKQGNERGAFSRWKVVHIGLAQRVIAIRQFLNFGLLWWLTEELHRTQP